MAALTSEAGWGEAADQGSSRDGRLLVHLAGWPCITCDAGGQGTGSALEQVELAGFTLPVVSVAGRFLHFTDDRPLFGELGIQA